MKYAAIALAAALPLLAPAALAEDMSIGESEYRSSCASCHGVEAKGGGPMAELSTGGVPDLTQLAKNNGGVFPFEQVYAVVDGRIDVLWHGSREMPVWGRRYTQMAAEQPTGDLLDQSSLNMIARTRILAIVDHLYSLQEK